MAKAKKLPSGSWRVLVYAGKENGKKKYKSFTAPTKKEAEFQAAQYAMERKERENGAMTVKEAYERYISSKENVLSPATVREYRRCAKKDLQSLMKYHLDDLTPELIQSAINEEAATHSPKSIRNMHGLLSAVLGMFAPDLAVRTRLPQKKQREYTIPTEQEFLKLLEVTKGTAMEIPILLAATGSLRRSEICAITSDDVKENGVTVNKAMVKDKNMEWKIKPPKTRAGYRFCPLPPQVIALLKTKQGRICPVTPDTITKEMINLRKKHNLPYFRFHDLRHYYASVCKAIGIPKKDIMLAGGWETESVLDNIYSHALPDKITENQTRIAEHFASQIQHEIQHE